MQKHLFDVAMEAKIFGRKRRPTSPMDFGDDQTVGLRLKRIGVRFGDFKDHDFGVYLGEVDGEFHVGTVGVMDFAPTRLESFPTLADLKAVWQLD